MTKKLLLLFLVLSNQISWSQCGGSLTINTPTTVLPGTSITATASGGNAPGGGYYNYDYQWLAMGGDPIRTGTSSGTNSNTFTTTFNNPGVYDICVTVVCGSGSSYLFDYQTICIEITVTEPDGSTSDTQSWCGGTNEIPEDLIGDAPTVCNFDDYCSTTIDYCGPDNNNCSNDDGINPVSGGSGEWTLENNSYLAFIANSDFACFDLDITCIPYNAGIQADILEWDGSTGTGGFTTMLSNGHPSDATSYTDWNNNFTRRNGTNRRICAENLVPGNTYYLLVDGNNGDFCNYSMTAVNGVGIPESISNFVNGTNTLNICESDLPLNLNLTSIGGDGLTYTWTENGSTIGSTQDMSKTLNSGTGTFEYIVTSQSAGLDACDPPIGTVMRDTVYVNVTPTAIVNPSISGDNTYCEGGSSTLTASPAGADFTWNTGASSSSIDVTEGTYSVSMTPSLANGCQQGTSADFVVGPPAVCLTACRETNGDLTALNGTPTYTWSSESNISSEAECIACPTATPQYVPFFGFYNGCSQSTCSSQIGTGSTITPGSNFPITLTDANNETFVLNSQTDINNLDECPSGPLPVDLGAFYIHCLNGNYIVKWETLSESGTSVFIIERRINNNPFYPIATINAAGNTTNIQSYEYMDTEISTSVNDQVFYQLKQVDLDGKTTVFGPITSNCRMNDILIYPNPSNGSFNIETPNKETYILRLFALDGKLIREITINESAYLLDIQDLASGKYLIQVIGYQELWQEVLIKQ